MAVVLKRARCLHYNLGFKWWGGFYVVWCKGCKGQRNN